MRAGGIEPVSCVDRLEHAPPPKREVPRCAECLAPTKCGKPYCTDHVEMQPYVRDLLERMVEVGGSRVPNAREALRDVLVELHLHGEVTTEGLARRLVLPRNLVLCSLRRAEGLGRVERRLTKWGVDSWVCGP